jgi:hypothetical protein
MESRVTQSEGEQESTQRDVVWNGRREKKKKKLKDKR